jgi:hypothetical protein
MTTTTTCPICLRDDLRQTRTGKLPGHGNGPCPGSGRTLSEIVRGLEAANKTLLHRIRVLARQNDRMRRHAEIIKRSALGMTRISSATKRGKV